MHLQMHSYPHWKKHCFVFSLVYLIFCFVITMPIEVTHNYFEKLNCSLWFYSFCTQSFLSAHVLKLQQRAVTARWWKWSCLGLLQASLTDFSQSDPRCQTDVTQTLNYVCWAEGKWSVCLTFNTQIHWFICFKAERYQMDHPPWAAQHRSGNINCFADLKGDNCLWNQQFIQLLKFFIQKHRDTVL